MQFIMPNEIPSLVFIQMELEHLSNHKRIVDLRVKMLTALETALRSPPQNEAQARQREEALRSYTDPALSILDNSELKALHELADDLQIDRPWRGNRKNRVSTLVAFLSRICPF